MHIIFIYYAYRGIIMRTTIDIPEKLITEAMRLTRIKTKTDVIKAALSNLIQREKIKDLKKYKGKLDLNINLDILRER